MSYGLAAARGPTRSCADCRSRLRAYLQSPLALRLFQIPFGSASPSSNLLWPTSFSKSPLAPLLLHLLPSAPLSRTLRVAWGSILLNQLVGQNKSRKGSLYSSIADLAGNWPIELWHHKLKKRFLALPPSKNHWGLKLKTLPLLVVGGDSWPTTTHVPLISGAVPLHSPSSGDHQKISFSLVCPPFRACPDDAGDAKAADGIGVIPVIPFTPLLLCLFRMCTLCHPLWTCMSGPTSVFVPFCPKWCGEKRELAFGRSVAETSARNPRVPFF